MKICQKLAAKLWQVTYLTWLNLGGRGPWSTTGGTVAPLATGGFVKKAAAAGAGTTGATGTPGKEIPKLARGKLINDSAGWSHFLFFLQETSQYCIYKSFIKSSKYSPISQLCSKLEFQSQVSWEKIHANQLKIMVFFFFCPVHELEINFIILS